MIFILELIGYCGILDLETIINLYNSYDEIPESLLFEYIQNNKNTVFFEALNKKAPLKMIVDLIELNRDFLQMKDENDNFPLHNAIKKRNISEEIIYTILNAYPNAVLWKNADGKLPLHLSIIFNKSFDIIMRLIEIYPEGLRTKDKDGNIPLHLAAMYFDSLDNISYIYSKYPNGINEMDNFDNLPVNRATMNKDPFKIVKFLLEKN